ncbi:hypothetical protein EG329_004557 [Mollisiaceae sp. DMI_Dod_QoI]|nr:hypothetical protein EG329_004557 [Helotiales sp. DMI_Dod_QoI]
MANIQQHRSSQRASLISDWSINTSTLLMEHLEIVHDHSRHSHSDFNIEPAVGGSTLLDPGFSFKVASYPWANKFVLEIHEYDEGISDVCFIYETILLSFGFDATTKNDGNRAPLVVTEWGHDESDASGAYKSPYTSCLTQFMVQRELGWMVWVLAGSYYIRTGTQDSDESYGLLDHTWSGYRGTDSLTALKQVIQETYLAYGQ